jgi:hypothetical protein
MAILTVMTELLDKAFKAAQTLPAAQQDAIARELLNRVAAHVGPTSRRPDLQRIRDIAARCSKRPVIDPRTADEIIGYDDFGAPK